MIQLKDRNDLSEESKKVFIYLCSRVRSNTLPSIPVNGQSYYYITLKDIVIDMGGMFKHTTGASRRYRELSEGNDPLITRTKSRVAGMLVPVFAFTKLGLKLYRAVK